MTTINEQTTSQLPTLIQLAQLGWEILPYDGKNDSPIREHEFKTALFHINPTLTEDLYNKLLKKLTEQSSSGLIETNKQIYVYLKEGISLDYNNIDGKTKSETFSIIDWKNIDNNTMIAIPEYRYKNARFDIAFFINGLPLGVIECKINNLDQAVNQINRYHQDVEDFFFFNQLNFALTGTFAQYGTTKTIAEFYSVWHETLNKDSHYSWENLPQDIVNNIFSPPFTNSQSLPSLHSITTDTDRYDIVQAMLSKDRFLDIIYNYIVFDGTVKKVARYQQFLLVENALTHIKNGNQRGLIWQTQGSGKSLLMIFLAQNIHSKIDPNAIIIISTDRVDLDTQISETLDNCNIKYTQASSGTKLRQNILQRTPIISTVMHKFGTADLKQKYTDEKVFIFVDEAHRTTSGELYTKIESLFPEACFFGFTGTPIYKKDKKDTFSRFDTVLQPSYTIRDALKDEAIVPLMYEARYLEKRFNCDDLDDIYISEDQENTNLINKYKLLSSIKELDIVIEKYAQDLMNHYRENFPPINGRVYAKAQLTVDTRIEALKYHQTFQKLGMNTQLVISTNDQDTGELKKFHDSSKLSVNDIKKIYNQENNQIELLIVVNMLITGFDAPINTILYINRRLKDHNLLQAIARVNRKYPNKSHGYIIDYLGLLGELKKTLDKYDTLSNFDKEDIEDVIFSVSEIQEQLDESQTIIINLLAAYNFDIYTQWQEVTLIRFLSENEDLRDQYYSAVTSYKNLLKSCKLSKEFYDTPQEVINKYDDFLKIIDELKQSIKIILNESTSNNQDLFTLHTLLKNNIELGNIRTMNSPFDITNIEEKQQHIDNGTTAPSQIIHMIGLVKATKEYVESHENTDPVLFRELLTQINEILDSLKKERYDDLKKIETIIQSIKDSKTNTNRYYENLTLFLMEAFPELTDSLLTNITSNIKEYLISEIENTKQHIGIWNKKEKEYRISIAEIIENDIPYSDNGKSEEIADKLLEVIKSRYN